MYRTTKLIKVDVWQMGLLYYVGAAIILFLQVRAVVDAGTYLLHEPIIGSVNPFAVGSTYDSVKAAAKETEYDYCKGGSAPAAWATIDVDNDFVYAPTCETLHKYEVATKSTDFISFITSSMNFQTYGWPCGEEGGAHATDALSKCDAGTNRRARPASSARARSPSPTTRRRSRTTPSTSPTAMPSPTCKAGPGLGSRSSPQRTSTSPTRLSTPGSSCLTAQ